MKNLLLFFSRCPLAAQTLLLSLALLAPAAARAQNFVRNPGFESPLGPDNWTVVYPNGSSESDFYIHGRTTLAHHEPVYGGAWQGNYFGGHFRPYTDGLMEAYFTQVVTNLQPGANYFVSAWMVQFQPDYVSKVQVWLEAIGASSKVTPYVTGYCYNNDGWAQYGVINQASSTGQIEVRLHFKKVSWTANQKWLSIDAFYDDVSVVLAVPQVSLNAPTNNSTFPAPATINLSATVVSNGCNINYVSFYNGGTLLSNVITPPYACSWTATLAGTNAFWAQALYTGAGRANSATNTVTVTSPPPVIVLSAPANNASFPASATISLLANVTSNYNAINSVGFYDWDTNLIASVAAPPYGYDWTNAAAGSYSLTARLAYNGGTTVDSAPAIVTVTNCPPLGIRRQPQSCIRGPGGSVSFQVTATNATAYQWRLNGNHIAGQTNAALNLSNLTLEDFGTYTVLVSCNCGSILSSPAELLLAAQPTVAYPNLNLTTFTLVFTTQVGPVYTVEFKNDLEDPAWHFIAIVAGTGVPITITDNAAPNTSRFYRIRVQ